MEENINVSDVPVEVIKIGKKIKKVDIIRKLMEEGKANAEIIAALQAQFPAITINSARVLITRCKKEKEDKLNGEFASGLAITPSDNAIVQEELKMGE